MLRSRAPLASTAHEQPPHEARRQLVERARMIMSQMTLGFGKRTADSPCLLIPPVKRDGMRLPFIDKDGGNALFGTGEARSGLK